jgi:peptidoglycan hydrolase-like protein with peptidoglycan-binding domain
MMGLDSTTVILLRSIIIIIILFFVSSSVAIAAECSAMPSVCPEGQTTYYDPAISSECYFAHFVCRSTLHVNTSAQKSATLAFGARGAAVRVIQEQLISLGYLAPDSATGFFGALTRAAVSKFQSDRGLEMVGYVGPKTKALLRELSESGHATQATISSGIVQSYAASSTTALIAALLEQVKVLRGRIASLKTTPTTAALPPVSSPGGGGGVSVYSVSSATTSVPYTPSAVPAISNSTSSVTTSVATTTTAYYSEYAKHNPSDPQKAAEELLKSGSPRIVFDAAYPMPIKVLNLSVSSNTDILIQKDVVLVAAPSLNTADNIFRLENVSNVTIRGEPGARLTADKASYMDGEWRHHIFITSSSNVTISGLIIENSGGDGIYIGSRYKLTQTSGDFVNDQIRITGNTIDNNSRNGISLIQGRNIYIEGNTISRTRSQQGTKVASHGPHAGIDIEPNVPNEQLYNVRIVGNTFTDNQAFGLALSLANMRSSTHPLNIVFDSNTISGSNVGIGISVPILNSGTITMRGNSIAAYGRQAIWIMTKSALGPRLDISHTSIDDTLPALAWIPGGIHAPLAFSKTSALEADGGITITNTNIRSNKGQYLYTVDNSTLIPYSQVTLGFILTDKTATTKVYKGRGYNESAFTVTVK